MSFVVIKPGLQTTVQDKGRFSADLPNTGALDTDSFKLANYLVGNHDGEAVLEFTLLGPTLQFLETGIFAITGGAFKAQLNGQAINLNQCHQAQKGDLLEIKGVSEGCRGYLSIRGEWAIRSVFSSKSTDLINGFGGYFGSALLKGDHITVFNEDLSFHPIAIQRNMSQEDVSIPAHMGPEFDLLSSADVKRLEENTFVVSNDSNRMGIRCDGDSVIEGKLAQMISSPVFKGVVQLPNNGLPIILLADCALSGGYPRILVLDEAACNLAAQLKPGDSYSFLLVK